MPLRQGGNCRALSTISRNIVNSRPTGVTSLDRRRLGVEAKLIHHTTNIVLRSFQEHTLSPAGVCPGLQGEWPED
jgi:hypothetical protein